MCECNGRETNRYSIGVSLRLLLLGCGFGGFIYMNDSGVDFEW